MSLRLSEIRTIVNSVSTQAQWFQNLRDGRGLLDGRAPDSLREVHGINQFPLHRPCTLSFLVDDLLQIFLDRGLHRLPIASSNRAAVALSDIPSDSRLLLGYIGSDSFLLQIVQVPAELAHDLDKEGKTLVDGDVQFPLDVFDRLSLQTESQQDCLLSRSQARIGAKPSGEEQRGQRGKQVEDDVIVEHIIRVGVDSLEVKRSEEISELVRCQDYIKRASVDWSNAKAESQLTARRFSRLCRTSTLDHAQSQSSLELPELVREKRQESSSEV